LTETVKKKEKMRLAIASIIKERKTRGRPRRYFREEERDVQSRRPREKREV